MTDSIADARETTRPDDVAADAEKTSDAGTGRVRWWRRVPTVVWAITALHVMLMLVATVLYPPFTGYDETWHVDMTWSYYQGDGIYGPGERLINHGVEVAAGSVPVPPPDTPYAQAPVLSRDDRQSIDELENGVPTSYPVPNQMVQHPPLFYVLQAGLLHALPGAGGLPYDQVVWILRFFNILMLAPLTLLCWATARRLTGDRSAAVFAAVVPVTIPGLTRLGGSVNNDNLFIILCAALLYLLARVVTGDLTKRTGLLVGVVTTLALLTKGFALGLPLVIAVAYAAAWLSNRRRPLASFGIAALVIAAVGSVWWVRNLIVYHAVQPSGLGPVWTKKVEGPARPGGTVQEFAPGFVKRIVERVWGGIGLPDAPHLPELVVYGWFVLMLLGAVIGIGYGIGGGGGWRTRCSAAVFLVPVVAMFGIVFVGSLGRYQHNQAFAGVQGRYLYGSILGIAVLAGWGWSRLARGGARFLPVVVLAAGLLTQAYASLLVLRDWWAPRAGMSDMKRLLEGLGGVRRWSPWPDAVTVVPFVLVILAALVAFGLAIWTALRSTTDKAPVAAELPSAAAS